MLTLTDEQVNRFNTALSVTSAAMILLTMAIFFSLDGLDMGTTSSCMQNIFGLWICLFITCMYTREQSYSSSGRWFVFYTAVLITFFTLEFMRRIPIDNSLYFFATGYSTMLANLVAIYAFWFYVRSHSVKNRFLSRMNLLVKTIFAIGVLFIVFEMFDGNLIGFDNGMVKGSLYSAAWAAPIALVLAMISTILLNCGSEQFKPAMLLFCIIPLVFVVLTLLNSKISFTEFAYIVSVMIVFGFHYRNRGRTIRLQKADLSVSRLNPHFLFNALTSIMYIEGNPQVTKDAIYNFTKYLRANIDTIGSDRPIPFTKEMEIVEAFVNLQRLRFKKDFDLVFDIPEKDFSLPALSVEILVENSLVHGLLPKNGEGTIRISSRNNGHSYEITVEDDGVGFDTDAPNPDTSREHTGIASLRERLKEISKGDLEITSEMGRGTVSTISIPCGKR